MNKKKIIVLMGGRSPEHEVSVISGQNVVKYLDEKKYDVFPVIISKDGTKWQLVGKSELLGFTNILDLKGTSLEVIQKGKNQIKNVDVFSDTADCVFIAMHGPFGEDGTVQGMLDLADIKYTGSGVLASALGMDKIAFRKYLASEKISLPKYVVLTKSEPINKIKKVLGKPPYFVKPSNQGSSVGSSIVKTDRHLRKALNDAFAFSENVLVDEYIKGTEVTVSVIGNKDPKALPVVEIVPLKNEYFDYASKYTESGAEEIVPAGLSSALTKKVQETAVLVHKTLGCMGFSRVDFIIKGETPYVLEINTIPGLTPMSLLPKAAMAAGMSYSQLLDTIVKYAQE